MKFAYTAVTQDRRRVKGVIEAKDINEAGSFLRTRGFFPTSISTEKYEKILKLLPFINKTSASDLVLFTRQLSSMLVAGLTLLQSLRILKEQVQNQTMKNVIAGIVVDIEGGKSLSYSLAKYPDIFSPVYISLIKSAEVSGLLDQILLRIANNLERQEKLKSAIQAALLYPAIVIVGMIAVVIIMMVFVIPQLSVLYDSLNIAMPLLTRIVIGVAQFFTLFWPLMVIFVFLAVFFFKRWHNSESGRLIIDDLVLKIPVFGKLFRQIILTELTRTFGLLVGSGILVVDALMQTVGIVGNVLYRNAIIGVSRRVERGITVGDAMSFYALFPSILVQMVKIGEETGKLDESLLKVSEYLEDEVQQTIKNLTTALEPLILVILGVGVGFLIISVITPIYNLISAF